jgi:CoA:oxalate CoA-transferase
MTNRALEGLKVLEYCDMVAGPYCGKLLADLGAESIKIEQPLAGDRARHRGPFAGDEPHPDKSGLFLYLNTNKLGITLDPTTATGRRIFLELAKDVDILIEDHLPGRMSDLGLSYDTLAAANPGLVMVSVTPFGQDGPYSRYNCYTLNLHHVSAHSTQFFVARFDDSGREPVPPGGHAGEYDGGLNAAIAAMAALFGRMLTGEGQYVDVSKQEGLLGLERVDICRFADGDSIIARFGMQIGGLMACKDGFVILTMPQDHQWVGLVEAMGSPEWARKEEYATEMGRAQNHDDIQPRVEAWALQFTKDEIYRICQDHSVPLGPVRSTAEVFEWQQARERGFFQEVDHPVAGRFYYPTAGYKLSATPWRADRPAPLLGQHNEEIYCGRLGYSKEDLARLRADGVI